MKSIKSSYNAGCPDLLSSGCISWNGPNIPSIGIHTGDILSEAVFIIAKKLCKLANDLDLSTLDIHCLLNLCEGCDKDRDLKSILQLILDNQCSLKQLIDSIDTSGNSETTIVVNMKCLKKYDDFGNEIQQDLNNTLQNIVNQVCQDKTDIITIKNQINDLQNQINSIDVTPTVTEVKVGTCIASSRPVSQALVQVANDYCNYKSNVGLPSDIQTAIGNQTPNLNTLLGSVSGWNLSPNNLADSLSNLWLAYTNLLARVKDIETNCCAPSCDKLKIGFITTIENNTVTLSFTSGAGTSIPSGFTDCGSQLTITSSDGLISNTYTIPIVFNQTTDPIDLSAFKLNDELTFNYAVKMCSEGLNCEKCVTKFVKYSSGCCVITNTSSDPITIVYSSPLTSSK